MNVTKTHTKTLKTILMESRVTIITGKSPPHQILTDENNNPGIQMNRLVQYLIISVYLCTSIILFIKHFVLSIDLRCFKSKQVYNNIQTINGTKRKF